MKLILKHKESGFTPRLVNSKDFKLSQNIMRDIIELENEGITTQEREDILIDNIAHLWESLHNLYSNKAKVTHDEDEGCVEWSDLGYHIVEWSENYLTPEDIKNLNN